MFAKKPLTILLIAIVLPTACVPQIEAVPAATSAPVATLAPTPSELIAAIRELKAHTEPSPGAEACTP